MENGVSERFKDKVVLVLGGNSGIGLAAAQAFAAEGGKVHFTGRNQETIDEAAASIPGSTGYRSDIADPAQSEQVVAALQENGLEKSQIKFELFGAPKGPRALRTGEESRKAPGKEECELTVIQDGITRNLTISKNNSSILDAALEQGLELPYSCKGGVCSTCRCKVVEGEVDMDANFALEDYEVARGFVLSCQSFPVTDRVVIDFDQET